MADHNHAGHGGLSHNERSLLIDPDMLAKIGILRELLHPMDELAAMESMLDRMKNTRSNDEFLQLDEALAGTRRSAAGKGRPCRPFLL